MCSTFGASRHRQSLLLWPYIHVQASRGDRLEASISRVRSALPLSTYLQVYEPRVGDFDVRLFLSLTQADAYNPLIVGTSKFALPSEDVASEVSLPSSSSTPACRLLCVTDILTAVKSRGEYTYWGRNHRVAQPFLRLVDHGRLQVGAPLSCRAVVDRQNNHSSNSEIPTECIVRGLQFLRSVVSTDAGGKLNASSVL